MRIVPVLYPCDLGRSERGVYRPSGQRGAADLLLGLLEEEGVRLGRPESVPITFPEAPDPDEAPLKFDEHLAKAVASLSEVVAKVNAGGHFPLVLGGDHTALLGHLLGHALRHPQGIGVAVLADAHLDLARPGTPVYDDEQRLKTDASTTRDGAAGRMVLSGALRAIPGTFELGKVMAKCSLNRAQTSVVGVRTSASAQVRAAERELRIEVWRMERLELDGEAAYRSVLSRHLAMGPIALSIDASGLDPALMPAVAEPVPDGLDWSFLKRTLEQCVPHVDRLLGLDLSGVDPTRDSAHQAAASRLAETLAPFLQRLGRA